MSTATLTEKPTAVFYDTGGGDIYGGPDRATILKKMQQEGGNEYDFDKDMVEVSGSMPMNIEGGGRSTLAEEYCEGMGAYCVASENC